MTYRELLHMNTGEDFRYTLLDVPYEKLAELLDAQNFAAIGELVWRTFDAAKEAIEAERENPDASPDHYLDDPRRGQAADINRVPIFLRNQAD